MARRNLSKTDHFEEVLAEVRIRLQDIPLAQIYETLESEIVFAQAALRGGCMASEDATRLALKIEAFIYPIPHPLTTRFGFDSAMIQEISEEWRQGGMYVSNLILPKSSDKWGHLTSTFARSAKSSIPLDLILFPGRDNLDGVNLLDYPFLCHEMGHNFLFTHDEIF